jgi:hypothetical protein
MLHGRMIGSMSIAIMPYSGYMLTRPKRDVTLDLKAVHSWPTCKYLPDIQSTQRDFVHISSHQKHQRYLMNLQSGLFSWGVYEALKPITKSMKPTIAQSATKYCYSSKSLLQR